MTKELIKSDTTIQTQSYVRTRYRVRRPIKPSSKASVVCKTCQLSGFRHYFLPGQLAPLTFCGNCYYISII